MLGGSSRLSDWNSSSQKSQLSIIYFNARSLLPKINELQALCLTLDPDVVCITESWLAENIEDLEIEIPGYSCTRLDRDRHGGGLVTYIRDTIEYKSILLGPGNLEFSIISLYKSNCRVCIALLYRPPSCPVTVFDTLFTTLQSLDAGLFSNFVLLGDFNIDFCNPHHYLYSRLASMLSTFSLTQVVSDYTHHGPHGDSLIDLVLLSQPSQLIDCSTIPPLGNSDHLGIAVTLKWRLTSKQHTNKPRSIWRYKYANFERACILLDLTNWNQVITEDVNSAWRNVQKRFLDVMEQCIPKGKLRGRRNLPWLNKAIVQAIRRRNRLYRERKRRNNDAAVSTSYAKARNQVTSMLRHAKLEFFKNLKDTNNREFWKTIRSLNKKRTVIPELNLSDGRTASTPIEKANALNLFFGSCFNQSCAPLTATEVPVHHLTECPSEFLCCEEDILAMLCSLDTSKASGPDGISGVMLKSTAHSIAPVLTKLFNLSIQTGVVPDAWKRSTVVPIPKSKAVKDPSNYRPISLLSICSKMLERHISHLLSTHLSSVSPPLLSSSQWGFMPRKGTTSALISVLHDWHHQLNKGIDICSVFFDLRKAFDTVPHRPLMHKLEDLNLDRYLLRWIHSYLSERKQCVVIDGEMSSTLPVVSGVPQGSVLGPLLFIIYIDGVESVTLSDGTVVMFADDMVLYRPIHTRDDYRLLLRDIEAVARWIQNLNLQFNISKCKYMVISRRNSSIEPPAIVLNGLPLERVSSFKYLGVHVSADLSWSLHVGKICTKGRRLVGLLYRRFHAADITTCKQLYVSFIRPHLEYACQVWDPHLKKDIEALESVQKFAVRACTRQWAAPYSSLLTLTGLPTLEERRKCMKLCTLYKIIHQVMDYPHPPISYKQNPYGLRYLSNLSLNRYNAKTNSFLHSFFPSTASAWNMLRSDLVKAPFPIFKRSLR